MKRYEYIAIELDVGDLSELNNLSRVGWKVVAVIPFDHTGRITYSGHHALLERDAQGGPQHG